MERRQSVFTTTFEAWCPPSFITITEKIALFIAGGLGWSTTRYVSSLPGPCSCHKKPHRYIFCLRCHDQFGARVFPRTICRLCHKAWQSSVLCMVMKARNSVQQQRHQVGHASASLKSDLRQAQSFKIWIWVGSRRDIVAPGLGQLPFEEWDNAKGTTVKSW